MVGGQQAVERCEQRLITRCFPAPDNVKETNRSRDAWRTMHLEL